MGKGNLQLVPEVMILKVTFSLLAMARIACILKT